MSIPFQTGSDEELGVNIDNVGREVTLVTRPLVGSGEYLMAVEKQRAIKVH